MSAGSAGPAEVEPQVCRHSAGGECRLQGGPDVALQGGPRSARRVDLPSRKGGPELAAHWAQAQDQREIAPFLTSLFTSETT